MIMKNSAQDFRDNYLTDSLEITLWIPSTSKDEDNPFLLGDFETQDVCMHSRAFVILKTKHKIHSDSRYLISRAEILYFACALDSIHRIV